MQVAKPANVSQHSTSDDVHMVDVFEQGINDVSMLQVRSGLQSPADGDSGSMDDDFSGAQAAENGKSLSMAEKGVSNVMYENIRKFVKSAQQEVNKFIVIANANPDASDLAKKKEYIRSEVKTLLEMEVVAEKLKQTSLSLLVENPDQIPLLYAKTVNRYLEKYDPFAENIIDAFPEDEGSIRQVIVTTLFNNKEELFGLFKKHYSGKIKDALEKLADEEFCPDKILTAIEQVVTLPLPHDIMKKLYGKLPDDVIKNLRTLYEDNIKTLKDFLETSHDALNNDPSQSEWDQKVLIREFATYIIQEQYRRDDLVTRVFNDQPEEFVALFKKHYGAEISAVLQHLTPAECSDSAFRALFEQAVFSRGLPLEAEILDMLYHKKGNQIESEEHKKKIVSQVNEVFSHGLRSDKEHLHKLLQEKPNMNISPDSLDRNPAFLSAKEDQKMLVRQVANYSVRKQDKFWSETKKNRKKRVHFSVEPEEGTEASEPKPEVREVREFSEYDTGTTEFAFSRILAPFLKTLDGKVKSQETQYRESLLNGAPDDVTKKKKTAFEKKWRSNLHPSYGLPFPKTNKPSPLQLYEFYRAAHAALATKKDEVDKAKLEALSEYFKGQIDKVAADFHGLITWTDQYGRVKSVHIYKTDMLIDVYVSAKLHEDADMITYVGDLIMKSVKDFNPPLTSLYKFYKLTDDQGQKEAVKKYYEGLFEGENKTALKQDNIKSLSQVYFEAENDEDTNMQNFVYNVITPQLADENDVFEVYLALELAKQKKSGTQQSAMKKQTFKAGYERAADKQGALNLLHFLTQGGKTTDIQKRYEHWFKEDAEFLKTLPKIPYEEIDSCAAEHTAQMVEKNLQKPVGTRFRENEIKILKELTQLKVEQAKLKL